MTTEAANPIIELALRNSAEYDRQTLPATRSKTGALIPLHQTTPVKDSGIGFVIWSVELPRQYVLEDALTPGLWKLVEIQLRQRGPRRPQAGDLMRVVRFNGFDPAGNFDAIFRIDQVQEGVGYFFTFYAGLLPAEGLPS
jgi:hypothetical protein